MQTTTKIKLRATFDRQSLKRKNAIWEIFTQRIQNSMNMNQLKINWNVHSVNDVFFDSVENLSMHELQIDFVTIRRFNLAIEMINFIIINLISKFELTIIFKFNFDLMSKSTSLFEAFTIVWEMRFLICMFAINWSERLTNYFLVYSRIEHIENATSDE
jgi:hypothetical protein